ncbi:hypothetical protein PQR14_23320 [Paraburkholderia bryophila]|uniref:hypothetical protein n=1 Tax=Paraburkholderia bryophila TaxID=420952 RepID=UPI0038BB2504
MSSLLFFIAFLFVIGAIVGIFDPKKFAQADKPAPTRTRAFFTFAVFAFIFLVAGAVTKPDDKPAQSAQKASTAPADVSSSSDATAFINKMESRMSKDDVKAFAGQDHIVNAFGGPLAQINVPQSDEEKKYLDESLCDDCDPDVKFLAYIKKIYPDVFKVKFKPDADIANGDKDTYNQYRNSFYLGLYFAKQIKLANNQTLFDFLTKCSQSVRASNSAQVGYDKQQKKYIYMQYFPILKHAESGKLDDVNVLFDRYGDSIKADSPLFSTSILSSSDFMEKHGFVCAK